MASNTIKYLNGTHSDSGCSDLRCPYNQYGECMSEEPCIHNSKDLKKSSKAGHKYKNI